MSLFRFFKTAGFSKIFASLLLCASCTLNLNASPNDELVRSLFSDANFDKNLHFKGEMRSYLKRKFYAADSYSEITVAPLGRSDEFSEIFHVFLVLKRSTLIFTSILKRTESTPCGFWRKPPLLRLS